VSAETPFRLAVVVVIVTTMSVGVYHRIRAHSGERFDRRQEGLALAIALRLAGLAMWIGTFAYLINPGWMAWAAVPLAAWARWLGAAVGAAGAGMMYWTMTSLGKNLTDTVSTRHDATLVTHGPYRYVRHPFYVTAGLLMLAIALLAANAAIGLCGLAVMALLALRTPKEEQKLLEKFGEPYRAYRQATGAFLPKRKS
jgi:protein-S-isoprenylcysteine O-methyltransferase Ste14